MRVFPQGEKSSMLLMTLSYSMLIYWPITNSFKVSFVDAMKLNIICAQCATENCFTGGLWAYSA